MFEANLENDQEQILIRLKGDLDVYSEEDFRDFIENNISPENKDIVIDIEELDYLDSTGLGMFMKIYNDNKEKGKKVKIINPKDNIKKLFEITDLTEIFEMV
ncbi:MAG: STAS domain-containing protein [Anaerococcus sp.]|nr:STAS domain-containing protein [Anaerococcus sp.]MDD7045100.1 STAS domain-containing protein [Peptoniphilaceae bacterium]MDY2919309.1 STAS domain-containing protein [Anaerococcus sp.]